jgi:hypothetical protein
MPITPALGGRVVAQPPAADIAGGAADVPVLTVLPLERLLLGENPAERVPDDAKRKELLDARTQQALTLIEQAFEMDAPAKADDKVHPALELVDQALAMGAPAKPQIKLHPETHTLLVKANQSQLFVVHEVLAALEVPGPSDAKKEYERQLADAIRKTEVHFELAEKEMRTTVQRFEEKAARLERERDTLQQRSQELLQQLEQLKAETAAREQRQSKIDELRSAGDAIASAAAKRQSKIDMMKNELEQLRRQMGPDAPAVKKLEAELAQEEKKNAD